MSHILAVEHVTVRFGQKIVLHDVSMRLADRGVTVLMGPGGSGKSTLLRLIEGTLSRSSMVEITGSVLLDGLSLSDAHRPGVVPQRLTGLTSAAFDWLVQRLPNRGELTRLQQREFLEAWLEDRQQSDLFVKLDLPLVDLGGGDQRRLALARELLAEPGLLCLDEITVGMEGTQLASTLDWIRAESLKRSVLFVTHNQTHAREVADYGALLAAGQMIEFSPAIQFFDAPDNAITLNYLRTGGCPITSPNDEPRGLEEDTIERELDAVGLQEQTSPYVEADAAPVVLPFVGRQASARGPEGFRWLRRLSLAGTPRPGIVAPLPYDVDALFGVGVTHVVTLTEQPLPGADELQQVGFTVEHFPILDMEAPTCADAFEMCERVDRWVRTGAAVAYHCKAGLGRTGTMLAAQLVFEGRSAIDALRDVRDVEPRWVQSRTQEAFLSDFEQFVAIRGAKLSANPTSHHRKENEYVP